LEAMNSTQFNSLQSTWGDLPPNSPRIDTRIIVLEKMSLFPAYMRILVCCKTTYISTPSLTLQFALLLPSSLQSSSDPLNIVAEEGDIEDKYGDDGSDDNSSNSSSRKTGRRPLDWGGPN
jgi:hypothetical protein